MSERFVGLFLAFGAKNASKTFKTSLSESLRADFYFNMAYLEAPDQNSRSRFKVIYQSASPGGEELTRR